MIESMKVELNAGSKIKRVIAVMSGKGGVGKSLVTALLALEAQKEGFRVGLLDADITGPSIPKMFGLKDRAEGGDEGLKPAESLTGIKIMSINLLLDREDAAVIWRGPLIAGTVKQFWSEVNWGELDYLFIDMPPGTGDVPLTVFQSLPVDEVIIVSTPQSLVEMIVKKAFNMANNMGIPVFGIVENMSYLNCPSCDERIEIFGKSSLRELAAELNTRVLAEIPLDSELAALSDRGEIEQENKGYLKDAFLTLLKEEKR